MVNAHFIGLQNRKVSKLQIQPRQMPQQKLAKASKDSCLHDSQGKLDQMMVASPLFPLFLQECYIYKWKQPPSFLAQINVRKTPPVDKDESTVLLASAIRRNNMLNQNQLLFQLQGSNLPSMQNF